MFHIRDNHKNRLAKLLTKVAFCALSAAAGIATLGAGAATLGSITILALATAHADVPGGSGGGNSTTDRYRKIENVFGEDQIHMRTALKSFAEMVSKFSSQGGSSAQIQDLIKQGLLEDIDKSPYVFSRKCTENIDGLDEVKDASTSRGVRNASICINIPRLTQNNASPEELYGLMMHEHARHFGVEDTLDSGLHPLAVFVTDRIAGLVYSGHTQQLLDKKEKIFSEIILNNFLLSTPLIQDITYKSYGFSEGETNQESLIYFFTTQPDKTSIVIDSIDGVCKNTAITEKYGSDIELKVGTKLLLNQRYVFNSPLPWALFPFSYGPSEECKINFKIQNDLDTKIISKKFSFLRDLTIYPVKVDLSDGEPRNWWEVLELMPHANNNSF